MTAVSSIRQFAPRREREVHLRASHPSTHWLKLVQEAVESADFGTVQIKVHGGEVVQIETTRKIRIPSTSSPAVPFPPTASTEAS